MVGFDHPSLCLGSERSLTPPVLHDYTKRPFTKSVKKSILTATSFLGKNVHEACVTCGVTRAHPMATCLPVRISDSEIEK